MLRVGTSGWDYDAWRRKFYPEKLPRKQRLAHYASKFSTVEVNYTFGKIPEEEVVEGWAAAAPEDFVFALKAPQAITHFKRLVGVKRELKLFLARAERLGKKRGPILFQLPPNFKADEKKLRQFVALLPDQPFAFEFRHPSWFAPAIYHVLRERNLALCIADSEDLSTPFEVTSSFLYLRLRRERYPAAELEAWGARLAGLAAFVYFKHEDTARGTRFAKQLRSYSERMRTAV